MPRATDEAWASLPAPGWVDFCSEWFIAEVRERATKRSSLSHGNITGALRLQLCDTHYGPLRWHHKMTIARRLAAWLLVRC